jgi:hypothetical protein
VIGGCSMQWTKAIQFGKIPRSQFNEKVDIEIQRKLVFVYVTIRSKQYRFILDSGAPFSISKQLQEDYNFKKVSSGKIIDSELDRKKVSWIQVDTIKIGNIPFVNQTAFVGDFNSNPILKCLEIDGILGSNLLRHCNWTIDQEQKILSLSNTTDKEDIEESIIIPFNTNYQYSIFIKINIGKAEVKNILVDYGSNGSISLNQEIFATLKQNNIIGETFFEEGISQSGIIGEAANFSREITYSDSVVLNNVNLKNVMLRTGKTTSVGNDLLSRYRVIIDWNNKKLYLKETTNPAYSNNSFGFKLGYSIEKGVYVQSVIMNSKAYAKGIRPNMRVMKLDTLDFERAGEFCDYVKYKNDDEVFLQLVDSTGQKQEYHLKKDSN